MPKSLPPIRTMDHEIELESGAKPPAHAPYRMSQTEFTHIDFLGHVIEKGRIKMNQQKVQAITDWLPPKDIHALRLFLGICNFYPQFVRNYSPINLLLTELLKKDTSWDWYPYRPEVSRPKTEEHDRRSTD
uniref:Uncharacterized mitochondrial protein AtMg00860-like n=1 Tax=Nicotiana tabacum TaxID=4097 RepID=A0A1S4B8I2_TOBAC|nr:PREDICTED: uncharacterized mitochondrial protein AtMg00860-like [Nicotiana tabacum]